MYGGLGIVFSLLSKLVELHSGRGRVESAVLDQGSTFGVSLTVTAARSAPKAPDLHTSAEIRAIVSLETSAGISVFVVVDVGDSLEVVRRILTSRNAQVQTVTTVDQALDFYTSFRPDVILSDIG